MASTTTTTTTSVNGTTTVSTVTTTLSNPTPESQSGEQKAIPEGLALPGAFSNPSIDIASDSRMDFALVEIFKGLGIAGPPPPNPLTETPTLEEIIAHNNATEAMFEGLMEVMAPKVQIGGVARRTEVIKGMDGNDVTLYIHTPTEQGAGPFPCIYHTHGGGMAVMSTANKQYSSVRDAFAVRGLVAVGVEFRNSCGKLGPHPFPAGLNDCMSGLQWVSDNKKALNITKVITCGESGGGNLAVAQHLRAKKEGKLELVDGTFALCPYIAGPLAYSGPNKIKYQSLYENNNIFLDTDALNHMGVPYTPTVDGQKNPLAWPSNATTADLAGLNPFVVSVNECDPLRDEGIEFYRKLQAAGVIATGKVVLGTAHAADTIPGLNIAVADATMDAVKAFAYSL